MFSTVSFSPESAMSIAAQPQLEPGRTYRTRDLRAWGANPTRLARRLVDEGKLREAAHGLLRADPLEVWPVARLRRGVAAGLPER